METTRTVVCKLAPTPEQAAAINATLAAFAGACDHAADAARRLGSTNKVKVQHACYRAIRETFGLSANLAVRAIARACAALKVPARMHSQFEPTSIDYDARIFAFQEGNWTFGLTLLSGRVKLATCLGERQKSLLKGQKPTSATLVQRRNGEYFLHVQLAGEAPEPLKPKGTLGVDLGRRRVAVDSDGTIHEATEVNRVRSHYPKVRRSAQAKGTRRSKRLLKRLSGREKRHQRAINHVIIRRIVDTAKQTGRAIVLEDLKGIRQRTKVRKTDRYREQSWSFFQLRSFIAYKAQDAGVPVVLIDPRYTSQTCHVCGERGHRDGLLFRCANHGDFDADINAAKFIAVAGARVTGPEGAGLVAQCQSHRTSVRVERYNKKSSLTEVTMRLAPGMMTAALVIASTASEAARPAQVRQTGSQPSVKWVGQDGHDYVGPNNRLEPSEIQDMHLVLSGLDPQREISFVDVTTGQGGDQWQYNARSFAWKAELKRPMGSRSADLFLEPGHVEAPRNYHVLFRYDNGTTHEFDVRGRKVSRSLRMPGAALQARWMGQEKQDRVGSGPSVGPDGVADVRIRLTAVSTRVPVKAMRVEGPGAMKWESGSNPELLPSAEYWPDPKKPGEGDLFFQPDRDLKGQKLKILVLYANKTLDAATITAGRCDPKLRIPESPLPRISELSATARWVGQDGQDVTGTGDVHVRLSRLARPPAIAAAVLTDSVHGTWVYRGSDRIKLNVSQRDITGPLAIRPGADRGSFDVFFAPYRDEARSTLTLRLIDPDGRMSVARFDGGTCDPGRCAARPAETRVEAKPGDDLNALVNQYGTVSLAEGTYRLLRPLVLNRPVTLTSEGKATLLFAQAATDAPWTAAIKIHCGQTTCNGFAVRFEGPIRWDQEVSYGPAVIGTTDNKDQAHPELKVNIVLTRLDVEIPPAADPSKWIDALRLIRLTNARGGMIAGNILRGGPIEFFDGPWQLLNNDFRGTPPGTISHGIFVGHGTYDALVRGNRAKPVQPDGKTWRFLVLTHRGSGDRVEENIIEDIGFREGDTIPSSNEPEIILTEAYHLTYEGRIAALAADGRLMRINRPQGQETATGDVVSLLTGPAAGQFRRIAQIIDTETYLVDPPIPKGTEVVSIARGFVGESFQKNRIDIRGGQKSAGMVLVGNHFGTRVIGNHLLGGANSIRFAACPTETPVVWGWSHAPFLGAVIEDNILEDAAGGAVLGVEHSARDVKSNKGRTYMTIALNRNVVRWTEPFLQRYASSGAKALPPGLILGHLPSHDPEEFVVQAAGNCLEAPAGLKAPESLLVRAAKYNAQKLLNRKYSLPTGPSGTADASRPDAAGSISGSSRR